jgi:hypothetical protein
MTSPLYREEVSSQIPAVRLLRAMGWTYLPASEALRPRCSADDHFADVSKMVPSLTRKASRR